MTDVHFIQYLLKAYKQTNVCDYGMFAALKSQWKLKHDYDIITALKPWWHRVYDYGMFAKHKSWWQGLYDYDMFAALESQSICKWMSLMRLHQIASIMGFT